MKDPVSLELFAEHVIRERLAQAARDALIAELPRPGSAGRRRPDLAARQLAANGLRALAVRLDPCAACDEPQLAVARPR